MSITLSPLEHQTLSQVFRFRLGVVEQFEKLSLFADNAIKPDAILERLCDTKLLNCLPLYGLKHCYQLAAEFDRHFDCDVNLAKSLSEVDKLRAYAMLRFCLVDAARKHTPLNRFDFESQFPQLFKATSGKRQAARYRDYYLTESRLGYLRVDAGGHGHWNRIVSKCEDDLLKHQRIPAYRELIDNGHFELTVVTAFETKANRICEAITNRKVFGSVPLRVYAFPELIEFISPPPLHSL